MVDHMSTHADPVAQEVKQEDSRDAAPSIPGHVAPASEKVSNASNPSNSPGEVPEAPADKAEKKADAQDRRQRWR